MFARAVPTPSRAGTSFAGQVEQIERIYDDGNKFRRHVNGSSR
jgi:hypothetical protein